MLLLYFKRQLMTDNQQLQLKTKIEEDLINLKEQIKELEELCKPIAPECALGDLARFELMNDQTIYEKSLNDSRIRLNRLNYAKERLLQNGELLCSECDDEIAFERLLAMPEAQLCIECALEES